MGNFCSGHEKRRDDKINKKNGGFKAMHGGNMVFMTDANPGGGHHGGGHHGHDGGGGGGGCGGGGGGGGGCGGGGGGCWGCGGGFWDMVGGILLDCIYLVDMPPYIVIFCRYLVTLYS